MKFLSGLFLLFFSACTLQKRTVLGENKRLKFIGQYIVPHNKVFQNTTVGGLSGIDYDVKNGIYYLISDDRSDIDPARCYTAKIHFNKNGMDSVQFLSVKSLLQPSGAVYPNIIQDPYHVPDPEGIRYNQRTKQLVWSDEGERLVRNDTVLLINPSIKTITTNGNYVDSFELPANMMMKTTLNGPRRNGVFEGLSFANNFKTLFVSVEEPLYEDGPRAGLKDTSAWIRIIKYDVKTRKPLTQYGFQIDPVAYAPSPPGAFNVNGIPEILAINDHQLLVMERSFSAGRKSSTIKVYLAELNGAEDVSTHVSLTTSSFRPVQKKLLLNMDALGIHIDNVEGITFGPNLSNGKQTLIFVSDNNFSPDQVTQFLLFTIE